MTIIINSVIRVTLLRAVKESEMWLKTTLYLELLHSLNDDGRVTRPEALRGLLVVEPLTLLHHGLHPLSQNVDVRLHQRVFL